MYVENRKDYNLHNPRRDYRDQSSLGQCENYSFRKNTINHKNNNHNNTITSQENNTNNYSNPNSKFHMKYSKSDLFSSDCNLNKWSDNSNSNNSNTTNTTTNNNNNNNNNPNTNNTTNITTTNTTTTTTGQVESNVNSKKQLYKYTTNNNNNNNNNNNGTRYDLEENGDERIMNMNKSIEDPDRYRSPLREVMNEDLVQLLRSQISRLLKENENVLEIIDEYKQKLSVMEREKRELAAVNPSHEFLSLQSELSEARLREAELTIAFEELTHRISAIDRLIETDPEMEAFFNAVTISTTSLSAQAPTSQHNSPSKQQQQQQQAHEHHSNNQNAACYNNDYRQSSRTVVPNQNKSINYRPSTMQSNNYQLHKQKDNYSFSINGTNDSDFELSITRPRSGLDSPQSDSGCSLTSHTTLSDYGKDGNEHFESQKAIIQRPLHLKYNISNNNNNNQTNNDNNHKQFYTNQMDKNLFNQNKPTNRANDDEDDDEGEDDDDDEEEEEESDDHEGCEHENKRHHHHHHSNNTDNELTSHHIKGMMSLLRRSRSSVTDKTLSDSFQQEFINNNNNNNKSNRNKIYSNRTTDNTPTPTENGPNCTNWNDLNATENKSNDRLSRLRASLRQSFSWVTSKPDFRMEALAARQGEARALVKLRETRLEVLKIQSRCQTLQRHIERLESINSCHASEIEEAMKKDREAKQEIRNLQTQMFQLEAEHREYKVEQHIKEMDLMSRLTETNLRLSHAEITTQQEAVLSKLSRQHDAVTELLTSANSQTSLLSPLSPFSLDTPINNNSNNNHNSNNKLTYKEDLTEADCTKSNLFNIPRYGELRKEVIGRKSDNGKINNYNQHSDNNCSNINYESSTKDRGAKSEQMSPGQSHRFQHPRDQSYDSLSEYRLNLDMNISSCKPDGNCFM